MPTILDSLFHKVVNTTSSPIGVEGGGLWGATKWWDPPIQKLFYGQVASIQAVFSSTYHKMLKKPLTEHSMFTVSTN